jgi:hypothetical protein
MRVAIAATSLVFVMVAGFLLSFVPAGPHPSDRGSVVVNEHARRVDVVSPDLNP